MSKLTMSGVAAAAAIAQEPVVKQVTFAITGDAETDFVAAIMASFGQVAKDTATETSSLRDFAMAQRVCEYLAARFKSQAEAYERRLRAEQQRGLWREAKAAIPESTRAG